MVSLRQIASNPKSLSLAVLTVQNTALVLSMRISRTRETSTMYLASVAVMTDELMKLIVCTVMLVVAYVDGARSGYTRLEEGSTTRSPPLSMSGFLVFFKSEVFKSAFDFFKMSIPACIYAVQKNLLYVAVSNLDAAVFQVAYQVALVVLIFGVALVQFSSVTPSSSTTARSDNVFLGSLAVLGACVTSGSAAIYFEWILKKSDAQSPSQQSPYNLWIRNFQLAVFAGASAFVGVLTKDGETVAKNGGLYQGFTPLVWTVVSLEAFGGIVVALVIKYADNILKNFATAVSIVSSVILSALFLGFTVRPSFVFGGLAVMAAVVMYTSNPKDSLFTRPRSKTEEIMMPQPATVSVTELTAGGRSLVGKPTNTSAETKAEI